MLLRTTADIYNPHRAQSSAFQPTLADAALRRAGRPSYPGASVTCICLPARDVERSVSGRCRGVWMATTNANPDSFGDRGPLLRWLVFTGLWVFAFVLLWRFGLIRQMVASDRTYLSSIIGLLYVAASIHCLWRTIVISREADAARRGGALIAAGSGGLNVEGDAIVVDGAGKLPPCLVSAHIHDLAVKARLQGPRRLDQTLLLRGLAGRLRGSNQFGAFA